MSLSPSRLFLALIKPLLPSCPTNPPTPRSACPSLGNHGQAGAVTRRALSWSTGAALRANQVMMHVIPDEGCCAGGGGRPSAGSEAREAGPPLDESKSEQKQKYLVCRRQIEKEKKQKTKGAIHRVASLTDSHVCTGEVILPDNEMNFPPF